MEQTGAKTGGVLPNWKLASHCHSPASQPLERLREKSSSGAEGGKGPDLQLICLSPSLWLPVELSKSWNCSHPALWVAHSHSRHWPQAWAWAWAQLLCLEQGWGGGVLALLTKSIWNFSRLWLGLKFATECVWRKMRARKREGAKGSTEEGNRKKLK